MRTHGSHGPSGFDANEWRRILTHFGQQLVGISKRIAKIAKKLATEELNPELMELYNACRLMPLDKNPGVKPIGIGEVMRRITGRTITKCLKNELMSLGSNYQRSIQQNFGRCCFTDRCRKPKAGIEKHRKYLPFSFNSD